MNKFKSIMAESHTKNKEYLHKLYTDKQVYVSSLSSSEQPIEDEKIFLYRNLAFQFAGTGFRTPERTILYVWVPRKLLAMVEGQCGLQRVGAVASDGNFGGLISAGEDLMVAYEDWLLRLLSVPVNALSEGLQNDHKDAREKSKFSMQTVTSVVQRRNGCIYVAGKDAFRLRIPFQIPLINGHSINGKSGYKGVKLLLDGISDCLEQMDGVALEQHIHTYRNQLEIRKYLKANNLLAFVADSSILPRQGDTDEPFGEAVPFRSPEVLRVSIPVGAGRIMTGMGLKRGITVITGGGYSGKSTLLDSLEQGIYNRVSGDGREYVLMDESACKIYAEDGRYVSNTDISPFFSHLPGKKEVTCFATPRASGSVSQATNIIEAVYGGSKCLLIDEDTSATNFMIRDETMRRLVQKEPIIPYTDRILELKNRGISSILVIGGSGEYLKYADRILLLEDYVVYDKTEEVQKNMTDAHFGKAVVGNAGICRNVVTDTCPAKDSHTWMSEKYMENPAPNQEFFYSESVQIENARYIRINEFVADITKLTAVTGENQINSLTFLVEKLLMETGMEKTNLLERCQNVVDRMFEKSMNTTLASGSHRYELCLEQVRSIDLLMVLCRLRGIDFS